LVAADRDDRNGLKLEDGKTSAKSKGQEQGQGHDDEMEEDLEGEVDEMPDSNLEETCQFPDGPGGSSIANPRGIPAALVASGK
jgi:hypothetical protein